MIFFLATVAVRVDDSFATDRAPLVATLGAKPFIVMVTRTDTGRPASRVRTTYLLPISLATASPLTNHW